MIPMIEPPASDPFLVVLILLFVALLVAMAAQDRGP